MVLSREAYFTVCMSPESSMCKENMPKKLVMSLEEHFEKYLSYYIGKLHEISLPVMNVSYIT